MAPTPQPDRPAEGAGAAAVPAAAPAPEAPLAGLRVEPAVDPVTVAAPDTAPRIVTERLVLDRLTTADTEAFFAYRSLPEVCRFQNFAPADAAGAADFIVALATVPWDSPDTWFQLAVRERPGAHLAGDLGVHFLDAHQVELGFTVAPRCQRRGYGTEAVRGVLNHLFAAMHKHRVTASVDARNEASVRLLRRLGLRQEAHFRQSLHFKGEWADDLVFAVLAAEWPAQRARS